MIGLKINWPNDIMIIPFQKLSREALRGVIEEFVTRDGTEAV